MLLGSGPLGRVPVGTVKFNPFYVVQTLGRVTQYGTAKIRVRFKVPTLGRRTVFGSLKTKLAYRAQTIPSHTVFGAVVLYGWHDQSQTYKNLNYWTSQGRIY
jgi:hypothetical protein